MATLKTVHPLEIKELERKANTRISGAIIFVLLGTWGVAYTSQTPGDQWVVSALTGIAMMIAIRLTVSAAVMKSGVVLAAVLNKMEQR